MKNTKLRSMIVDCLLHYKRTNGYWYERPITSQILRTVNTNIGHMSVQDCLELCKEHGKKVALRAYIVDGEMHIKFQGEDKTRTTKSFKTEADSYSVEIKKKNFGKYVFKKQDVKVY